MTMTTFDSEGFCGYTQITTFFADFSIADNFGIKAIKDTYKRAFQDWKNDYKYLTELVLVLNWKSWEHASRRDYCELYANLFYDAQEYAYDNLTGEELEYFITTTD